MIFELCGYEYDENGGIVQIATDDSYAGAHNMNCEQRWCDSEVARDNMLLMGYHYAKIQFEEWLNDPVLFDDDGIALVNCENIREFIEAFQDSIVEDYAFADNGVYDDFSIPLSDEMYDDIEDELSYIGCDVAQDLFVSGITTYFNNHALEIENAIYELLGGETYRYINSQGLSYISKDYARSPHGYNDYDPRLPDEELDEEYLKYKSLPNVPVSEYIPNELFASVESNCTEVYDFLILLSVIDVANESYDSEWIYLDEIMAMALTNIVDILNQYSVLQYKAYKQFCHQKSRVPDWMLNGKDSDKQELFHSLVFHDYDFFDEKFKDIVQHTIIHLLNAWFDTEDDSELIYLSNKYPSMPLYTYHSSKSFTDCCIVVNLSALDYIRNNYDGLREWILWNMKYAKYSYHHIDIIN